MRGGIPAAVSDRLTALRRAGPAGSGIGAALARGARWRLREALGRGDVGGAVRIGAFAARAGGLGRASVESGAVPLSERRRAAFGRL